MNMNVFQQKYKIKYRITLFCIFLLISSSIYFYLSKNNPVYEDVILVIPDAKLLNNSLAYDIGFGFHPIFEMSIFNRSLHNNGKRRLPSNSFTSDPLLNTEKYFFAEYRIKNSFENNLTSASIEFNKGDNNLIRTLGKEDITKETSIDFYLKEKYHLMYVSNFKELDFFTLVLNGQKIQEFLPKSLLNSGYIYIFFSKDEIYISITDQFVNVKNSALSFHLLQKLALELSNPANIIQVKRDHSFFKVLPVSSALVNKKSTFSIDKSIITNYNHKDQNLFILALSILLSFTFIVIVYQQIIRQRYKYFKESILIKIFFIVFLYYFINWLILFPGQYMCWDVVPDTATTFRYSMWFSTLYWIVTKFSLLLGGLHILVLINVVLMSITMSVLIYLILNISYSNKIKYLKYILILFLLFNPYLMNRIYLPVRIVFAMQFAFAGVALVYYSWFVLNLNQTVKLNTIYFFGVFLVLLAACFRVEYIFILFIVLLATGMRFHKTLSFKRYIPQCIFILLLCILSHSLLPSMLQGEGFISESKHYKFVSYRAFLEVFVHDKDLTENEHKKLSELIPNYDTFRKCTEANPPDRVMKYGNLYFNLFPIASPNRITNSCYKGSINDDLLSDYILVLVKNHFLKYLEHSLSLMLNTAWSNDEIYLRDWYSDPNIPLYTESNYKELLFNYPIINFGYYDAKYLSPLKTNLYKGWLFVYRSYAYTGVVFLTVFSWLLIIILFFLPRYCFYTWCLNFCFAVKLGITFLLAPEAGDKYRIDFIFWGLLLPLFIYYERKIKFTNKSLELKNVEKIIRWIQ